ncbi:histidine kinase [Bryobacterales bacterium F-183]|nr:histidine kinase [Bryobacterales bacterium F-183]
MSIAAVGQVRPQSTGAIPLLPSQYVVDEWTSDLGMPEETASEMVRIPNDHLLIATAQGVIRFDGQRFRTLYPDLPKASVHSIIWTPGFGAECAIVGYGVAAVQDTSLTLRHPFNLPSHTQRVIRRDRNRRLLFLVGAELYREDRPGGELRLWRKLPAAAQRMLELPDGSWIVSVNTDLYRVTDHDPSPLPYLHLTGRIEALQRTRGGSLYIGTSEGLFRHQTGETNVTPVRTKLSVFAIAESAAGEVWIGTERGLERLGVDGKLQPFSTNLHLRPEPISSILCDDDGSIWAAYVTGGLFRLRRPRFANWSMEEGLLGGVVQSAHHDQEGGVWVVARGGLHHLRADGTIRDIDGDWKVVNAKHSVYSDAEHKLWILGNWELREVDTISGAVRKLPLPPSNKAWFRLHRRASGERWIVNVSGKVYKWIDGGWTQLPLEGMPSPPSTGTLVESPFGETWIAIRSAGLFRLAGNRVEAVAPDDPARLIVHSIYPDQDGNVWLGFDGGGLGLYENGRIYSMSVDPTVQLNSTYLIAEDKSGYLWFGLRSGLLRIEKKQLLGYLRGKLTEPLAMDRYTAQGDLPSGNFGTSSTVNHPRPASVLWLPHLRGLVRVDAATVKSFRTPPTPHIDQVLVDDVPYPVADGTVVVPPGAQRVTIGFHGTFLPEPMRVTYRYQLDNFQQTPSGPYPQREATFTQLPPGSYTFRLWSANSDGVWNTDPLRLHVHVQPAFYQTFVFRLCVLAGLCLIVYAAINWRTRILRRDKEELEKRVEARTHELEEARITAENAAKVKSDFLATMSHEIRTPLHGVLGTLELLGERPLDGEEREYVRTAKDSGQALLQLLNDVLDLSRLEAGYSMLQPEEFAFPELCTDVVAAFRHAATIKGLELKLQLDGLPPRVVGDPSRLRQILSNLLGNAIKFTDTGWVELSVKARPADHRRFAIRFQVTDTGVGIDPAKFDALFQPFSQLDGSSKKRYKGTGLGLAICRRLCEDMAGHISVNSQPGGGAQFLVDLVLPGGANQPAALPDSTQRQHELGQLVGRILLVEDNRVNQLVAARMLTRLGCTFDIAVDGIDGVEQAAKSRYDAILMDCNMPRATGTEATRMIRSGGGPNSKTPVIALTAGSSSEDREACTAAGMEGFLTKPYSLAQLYSVLSPYLEHAEDSTSNNNSPILQMESP